MMVGQASVSAQTLSVQSVQACGGRGTARLDRRVDRARLNARHGLTPARSGPILGLTGRINLRPYARAVCPFYAHPVENWPNGLMVSGVLSAIGA